jgi:hypothetical protein
MKRIRRSLAVASIIIGGTAAAIPDPTISKILIAFSVSLNAASLYLLKEEAEDDG